jgi:hypothetical protein
VVGAATGVLHLPGRRIVMSCRAPHVVILIVAILWLFYRFD